MRLSRRAGELQEMQQASPRSAPDVGLVKFESTNQTFLCARTEAIIPITDFQDIIRLEANNARIHLNIPVSPTRAPLEWLAFTDVSRKRVGGRRRSRTQFLNYISFNVEDVQCASCLLPPDEDDVSATMAGYHCHCEVAKAIKGRWFE